MLTRSYTPPCGHEEAQAQMKNFNITKFHSLAQTFPSATKVPPLLPSTKALGLSSLLSSTASSLPATIALKQFSTLSSETSAKPAAKELEGLTIASFNVVKYKPSDEASDWSKSDSLKAVQKEILRDNPDIISLQEHAEKVVGENDFFPGYTVIRSDDNTVLLLVKDGINAERVDLPNHRRATMAKLTWDNRELLIAAVHLKAGGDSDSAEKRERQMRDLVNLAESTPFVIAGDTNMREVEGDKIEKELKFVDLWKEDGGKEENKHTMDTLLHCFHRNFPYTFRCRYDRIMAKDVEDLNLQVSTFKKFANKPITNNRHFLSDHFGLVATFELDWPHADEMEDYEYNTGT